MRWGIGWFVLAVALGPMPAVADSSSAPATQMQDFLEWVASEGPVPAGTKPPHVAFGPDGIAVEPPPYDPDVGGAGNWSKASHVVVGYAADHKAGWMAADLAQYGYCGAEDCAHAPPIAHLHASGVFVAAKPWHPLAYNVARVVTDHDLDRAFKKGVVNELLSHKIAKAAAPVVAVFEKSLGDPKRFVATVSSRSDVVLYGSAPGERYVGSARVKAQLRRWNFAFKVHGGIHAGLAGHSVAWIACVVEVRPAGHPDYNGMPYRLLAVYEKAAPGWQLVLAQFSFIPKLREP